MLAASGVGAATAPVAWPTAMYAVIDAGANQQRVAEGQQVQVDLLDAEEGDEVDADRRSCSSTATPCWPRPDELSGVTVTGRVVGTAKGPKINGFTYKRRTNQRRRYGHRQRYTVVEITTIAK